MEYPFGYVDDTFEEAIKSWNLIHDELLPIMHLYKDPSITDIFVDRYDDISVMRNSILEKVDCRFDSEDRLVSLIQQFCVTLDQDELNLQAPILDARLPDGSRINATHVSTTPSGSTMALRKVPIEKFTTEFFLKNGMFTEEMLEWLIAMVR
ncbi:hypothetical protein ACQJ2X_29695, partial [Bacillus wiedmannii]